MVDRTARHFILRVSLDVRTMYSYEPLSSLKLSMKKKTNTHIISPGHWVYRQYTRDSWTFRHELIRVCYNYK